jgi:hypothetical protein
VSAASIACGGTPFGQLGAYGAVSLTRSLDLAVNKVTGNGGLDNEVTGTPDGASATPAPAQAATQRPRSPSPRSLVAAHPQATPTAGTSLYPGPPRDHHAKSRSSPRAQRHLLPGSTHQRMMPSSAERRAVPFSCHPVCAARSIAAISPASGPDMPRPLDRSGITIVENRRP